MNDTETRLRDYLHAKATGTVPGDTHGPGPEFGEPTRHRSWLPITAVAAGWRRLPRAAEALHVVQMTR